MNFLSGVKSKSVLGRKLSNRYLSRDAFTSTNRPGGRGVRRLGAAFKTRRSLFELKFTVMKVLMLVLLCMLVVYTIPTFRFMIHGQFVESMLSEDQLAFYDSKNQGEFFVAPKYLSTDIFRLEDSVPVDVPEGLFVQDALTRFPIGILTRNDNVFYVKLFSDPEFKNNFFFKVKNNKKDIATGDLVQATTTEMIQIETETEEDFSFESAVFTGSGYGEIMAKMPPQEKSVQQGDMIYVQTTEGLKPIAVVHQIQDKDSSGSTFTFVYAQLLVSPQKLYKVYIPSDDVI